MQNAKWFVFLGAALAIMMVDIDMTAVNLAIADITKTLGLGISGGQWIVNGYTMAAACLMAFAGRIGDSFGHKRVFLIGLGVFAVGSLSVALANSLVTISIARIVQGASIAFTFPMAAVFVREVFPESQKGLAVSLLISVAGISQAIGPSFGGMMIYFFSWHWIFLINIPLALLCFYFIGRFLSEPKAITPLHVDLSALLSLIVGQFALMTALNEVNEFGLRSFQFIGLFALSLIALAFFIHREWRAAYPLLGLRTLLNKGFSKLLSTRLIVTFVYFTWLFGLGLLLQKGFHYNAFDAGLIMMMMTITLVVFSIPVGKWIDHAGFKPPLLTGFLLMLVTCLLLSHVSLIAHLSYLLVGLFTGGLATALLIPATTAGSFHLVKHQNMGLAMGLLLACGFIGNSLGVAISGSVMDEVSVIKGFGYSMLLCAMLSVIAIVIAYTINNE